MVLPRSGARGFEVSTTLEGDILERLRGDETFRAFADLRCC